MSQHCGAKGVEALKVILTVVAIVALWIVLQRVILPKLGIST